MEKKSFSLPVFLVLASKKLMSEIRLLTWYSSICPINVGPEMMKWGAFNIRSYVAVHGGMGWRVSKGGIQNTKLNRF